MASDFDISRKIVANMTSESWRSIPHVCFSYEPDITEFEKNYKDKYPGASLNTVLLSLIAKGLKEAPKMNAHFSYNRWLVTGKLSIKDSVDVSMPTILPDGRMMTLNIHDCDLLNPAQLQMEIDDTVRRAEKSNLDEAMMSTAMANTIAQLKHGKVITAAGRLLGKSLHPECANTPKGKERKEYYSIDQSERLCIRDIEQGSITVSNFGSLYKQMRGRPLLLEVVPPQTTAIGIGSVQNCEGRRILPMCIAFDHRALDFGDIVPFIKAMDRIFGE